MAPLHDGGNVYPPFHLPTFSPIHLSNYPAIHQSINPSAHTYRGQIVGGRGLLPLPSLSRYSPCNQAIYPMRAHPDDLRCLEDPLPARRQSPNNAANKQSRAIHRPPTHLTTSLSSSTPQKLTWLELGNNYTSLTWPWRRRFRIKSPKVSNSNEKIEKRNNLRMTVL